MARPTAREIEIRDCGLGLVAVVSQKAEDLEQLLATADMLNQGKACFQWAKTMTPAQRRQRSAAGRARAQTRSRKVQCHRGKGGPRGTNPEGRCVTVVSKWEVMLPWVSTVALPRISTTSSLRGVGDPRSAEEPRLPCEVKSIAEFIVADSSLPV